MFLNFIKPLLANKKVTRVESFSFQCKGQKRKRQTPRAGPNHRLTLETLEDRCVPAQVAWVPDELLISFRPGTAATAKESAHAQVNARFEENISTPAMQHAGSPSVERWHLSGMPVEQAIAALSKNPNVLFAEPNYIYTRSAVSNDPYYTSGNLWGMEGDTSIGGAPANQFGSAANQAWNAGYTGSKTVYVGIVDEGYQYTHPDLVDNVGFNPGEIPNDGQDNDSNGYIDDVYGWDFVHNDNTIYDASENFHGTHVAGIMGAKGGNALGVAGVNWNVSLLSAKFLGPSGGTTANAIKAVDYFTNLKVAQNLNIVATNNSWGGGAYSQALQDAITRAAKANILFVAAAGNATNNNDASPVYPSSYSSLTGSNTEAPAVYENVISVAALTSTGDLASFSNYGLTSVDLAAPGLDIYSTVPTNTYTNLSGTSMAAPFVTGSAALYASRYPGVTAEQIRDALLLGATSTPSLFNKTSTGDRLNTWSTLQIVPTVLYPKLSISDVSLAEGNSGTSTWAFTVALSFSAPVGGITVHWSSADGSATVAGNDYIAGAGIVDFAQGESSKTINVVVLGDTLYEPNEYFFVNLSNPLGATILDGQGVGTILNDDSTPNPLATILDASAREGNNRTRSLVFPLNLSVASSVDVSIGWGTANGTAIAGLDYLAASGTVLIPAGSTKATITIEIIGDKVPEADEYFFVNLTGGFSFVGIFDSQAKGTIINDDRGQAVNEVPFNNLVDNLFVPDSLVISMLLEQTGPGKPKG